MTRTRPGVTPYDDGHLGAPVHRDDAQSRAAALTCAANVARDDLPTVLQALGLVEYDGQPPLNDARHSR